jgi:hypothetical protein
MPRWFGKRVAAILQALITSCDFYLFGRKRCTPLMAHFLGQQMFAHSNLKPDCNLLRIAQFGE